MPKKTKKEKIIAQLRRKLETAGGSNEITRSPAVLEVRHEKKELVQPSIINYSLQDKQLPIINSLPKKIPSLENQTMSLSFIIRDLRKTFFLAGLAISLEFIIYWLIELGGSKLLKFLPMFR